MEERKEALATPDLDALAALYEQTTQGEWYALRGRDQIGSPDAIVWLGEYEKPKIADGLYNDDCEFIAALHNAFPQLLALAREGVKARSTYVSSKPTVEELERLLNAKDDTPVEILSDGSIRQTTEPRQPFNPNDAPASANPSELQRAQAEIREMAALIESQGRRLASRAEVEEGIKTDLSSRNAGAVKMLERWTREEKAVEEALAAADRLAEAMDALLEMSAACVSDVAVKENISRREAAMMVLAAYTAARGRTTR